MYESKQKVKKLRAKASSNALFRELRDVIHCYRLAFHVSLDSRLENAGGNPERIRELLMVTVFTRPTVLQRVHACVVRHPGTEHGHRSESPT